MLDERFDEDQFRAAIVQLNGACEAVTGRIHTGLRQLIENRGGVGAAEQLLDVRRVSAGFRQLAEIGRLDLTVEALVVDPRSSDLFDDRYKRLARRRLLRYGWQADQPADE